MYSIQLVSEANCIGLRTQIYNIKHSMKLNLIYCNKWKAYFHILLNVFFNNIYYTCIRFIESMRFQKKIPLFSLWSHQKDFSEGFLSTFLYYLTIWRLFARCMFLTIRSRLCYITNIMAIVHVAEACDLFQDLCNCMTKISIKHISIFF